MTDAITPDFVAELAPTGRLRAAINFGNSVLAQADPAGGAPRGVSAELARELARRLGVGIDYVAFDAAGKVVAGGEKRPGGDSVPSLASQGAPRGEVPPPPRVLRGGLPVARELPLVHT